MCDMLGRDGEGGERGKKIWRTCDTLGEGGRRRRENKGGGERNTRGYENR